MIGKTLGEGTFGKVKIGTHVHTGEKVGLDQTENKKWNLTFTIGCH
jgi:5'-AMP-activated protein kinase catalytic alpha subunit